MQHPLLSYEVRLAAQQFAQSEAARTGEDIAQLMVSLQDHPDVQFLARRRLEAKQRDELIQVKHGHEGLSREGR